MIDLLKDMKKISEDAKSVTMAHPKGHTMVIVYKGLPAIQKEALRRLPLYDGGEVKGVHKAYFDEPETKQQMGESKAGDKVRHMDINKSSKNEAKEEHHKVLGEMKSMPNPKLKGLAKGGMAHYNEGSQDGSVSNDDAKSNQDEINNLPQLQEPQMGDNASQQALPGQDVQAPPTAQINVPNTGSPEQNMVNVRGQYGQGLNQEQQDMANAEAIFAKAKEGWDKFNANPESKIDADQYRKSLTLPQKVIGGIGLFLGGFSVPFGGHNFAQDFLNKQVENNIDAQKQNYEHQKNVYGAALDLFHNDILAHNFTKSVLLDQLNNSVIQGALQSNDPKAMIRGQALVNGIKSQQAQIQKESAPIINNQQKQYKAQGKPGFWDTIKNGLMGNGLPAEAGTMPPGAYNQQNIQSQNDQSDSEEVPKTDPIPQFQIDSKRFNQSQFLGSPQGGNVPNELTPAEVGDASREMGAAQQLNDKIKLIHNNFASLWKNRSDSNAALKWLSNLGVNVGGAHLSLPDMSSWTPKAREYYRAASTIENELSTLVGSGGLTEAQANTIRTKLIKKDDTPEEYRNILKSIDNNMLSTLQTPILLRHNIIKRPKIVD